MALVKKLAFFDKQQMREEILPSRRSFTMISLQVCCQSLVVPSWQ
jgi:hypothetical protein